MSHARHIGPNERVHLGAVSCLPPEWLEREDALAQTEALGEELSDLLELLFAAGTHALLVVFQGRDAGGKDGAIRRLLEFTNVQSTRVTPFKVPTPLEASHDFLWRVHQVAPAKGSIALFNRSHYEDVIAARVHRLFPEQIWSARYEHINAFERLLHDSGTLIVKFFLHISREEQEQRLLERERETEKAWKLNVGDWRERELWDETTAAYEDALTKCAKEHAPWWVVPADRKWFRDLCVFEALVRQLRPHRHVWMESLEETGRRAKADLEAYRRSRNA